MITIHSCDIEKYRSLNQLEKWFFRNGGINWMAIMPFVNFAGLFYICTNYHWFYYLVFLLALFCLIGFVCVHYDGLIYTEHKCKCGGDMKSLGIVGGYDMSERYRCESCNSEVEC